VAFRNKQPVIWNLNAAAIEFKVELQSWWIQHEDVLTGKEKSTTDVANLLIRSYKNMHAKQSESR
jgi:hypothetical protein